MASKGKGIARQPCVRTRGSASHQQISQEVERYETPNHAERGKILSERNVIHEPTIKFRESMQDTFKEHIFVRGDIERVLHIPRLEGRNEYRELGEAYDKNEQDMNKERLSKACQEGSAKRS
ncbi:hypothetical protein PIB30_039730 [Stylosanthes scabra]|uniref:Uncharacterized protein n=1 Tax=Stylosanthes scabra TaxID=79078 RepID=A0ABU6RF24_9FABA|nr:hypothetical protein [Stylosanthes scabra]